MIAPDAALERSSPPPGPASRRPLRHCACGASLEGRHPAAQSCSDSHRKRRHRRSQLPTLARRAQEMGLPIQDFWGSPPEVVELGRWLCAEVGLRLAVDLAATAEDRVLPRHLGLDLGLDALVVDWPIEPGEAGWLNPPYSRKGGGVAAWVAKAIREMEAGRPSILLVNVEPSAAWRPLALARADRFIEFTGRLSFLHPLHRRPCSSNRHSSALILFHTGRGAVVELLPRPCVATADPKGTE